MTTKHQLTEAEALALVEDDTTGWTRVNDEGDAEAIREQVRIRDAVSARLDEAVIRARRRGLTWME
ncbi:MAG: hypothetical protein ACR2JU_15805, partial [Nocardioidaceae bacterium]